MKKKTKIDVEKFQLPPIPLFNLTRERAIVEENKDSKIIGIESKYSTYLRAPLNRCTGRMEPKLLEVTKKCPDFGVETWRIIGSHTTDTNGEILIKVTEFLNCENIDYNSVSDLENSNFIGSIPLFLLTAQSGRPIFLTYELCISQIPVPPPVQGQLPATFLPNPAIDVQVIVRSWKHDGTPAASILFSWMAIGEKTSFYNP